jgi:predicted nucleotidyltransferase
VSIPPALTLRCAAPTIHFMRLSDRERNAIVSAVHVYDAHATVFLFGSRADDAKKGGDIDLLIRSASLGPAERRRIRRAICDAIGEQKIDIIVAADLASPMARLAQRSGVLL